MEMNYNKNLILFIILILLSNMLMGILFMSNTIFIIIAINIMLIFMLLDYDGYHNTKAFNELALSHLKLSQRYLDMINLDFERRHELNINLEDPINEKEKIYLMVMTISENVLSWPPDKCSRWLGYCQYYMINEGYTTVDKEREYSRPLFHRAYEKLGYKTPKTIKI